MNPILRLNLKRFLWSVAILLLVTGSDQLGWQAGHKAGKAEQVQSEPMSRALLKVLERVEQNQKVLHGFAHNK